MSRSLRWLSLLLLPLCLSACSGLLFMPMKTLVRTPADVGLAWRDVSLRAADGTALDAWWLPAVG
ncbi:MAG: alpha/beta hydrolase, partial [Gammaproteobacteria bacterium PRO9]|nr:alpha/beta hydrolase [Gammaproteobacteria bacterium PRO9]